MSDPFDGYRFTAFNRATGEQAHVTVGATGSETRYAEYAIEPEAAATMHCPSCGLPWGEMPTGHTWHADGSECWREDETTMSDDPLRAALERQHAVWKQMTERSGPGYATAAERSRAVADAYRAAGSPPRVTSGRTPLLYGPLKARGEQIPATPQQAAAWRAWVVQRERLRRELRNGKPSYVDAATARETAAGSTVTPEQASAAIEEHGHGQR